MKTVRTSVQQREGATSQKQVTSIPLRFIAVSATIPNIHDVKYYEVVNEYNMMFSCIYFRLPAGWGLNRTLLFHLGRFLNKL